MKIAPNLSPQNASRTFYAVIRPKTLLTADQRSRLDADGEYPVELVEHLPAHETFLDYLIDRSLEAWARAAGGGR